LKIDAAAVRDRDLARDVETEARASDAAAHCSIEPIELVEDSLALDRADGAETDVAVNRNWIDPGIPFTQAVARPAHGIVVTSATLTDGEPGFPADDDTRGLGLSPLAYAFIGVIGSEFIMARSGMGYEIGYAYTNFDNATMYPLILLILLLSILVNGLLSHWEKTLLARRGLA